MDDFLGYPSIYGNPQKFLSWNMDGMELASGKNTESYWKWP